MIATKPISNPLALAAVMARGGLIWSSRSPEWKSLVNLYLFTGKMKQRLTRNLPDHASAQLVPGFDFAGRDAFFQAEEDLTRLVAAMGRGLIGYEPM